MCMCVSVCMPMSFSVCLLSAPSQPEDLTYISSTESSMTLSWEQSGNVDKYIVRTNGTESTSVNFTGVGDVSVSVTVSELPTSGMYYCISVTAVSGHLSSDDAVHCNYTGNSQLVCRTGRLSYR